MKKFKNILSITVVSIIVLSVFLYSSISNKSKIKLDTERSVKNSLKTIQKLELGNQYDIIKILNDSLFFISWTKENQGNLYQFNSDKNTIEKYASLKKELIIGNYFRINDNEFLIVNNAKKQLLIFGNNGELKKTYNVDTPIARGVLSNNLFLFTSWGDDLILKFYEYDLTNGRLKQIQNKTFEDSRKNSGVLYDGVLKMMGNKIALIPYAANEVLFFDSDFKFTDKLKLISQETEFKLTKMKNGEMMVDPNNLYPNIYADIYGENLYILTNESGVWDSKDKYYVDVYNIQEKKYLYSYYIDDNTIRPREITVRKNQLYVLGKDKLNIYEIK
ncbi:hypothetical protein [Chryseobacterium sp. Mn2064]|uniref:hypothetical protein n=1 Tax=Chryseobacterium sp. Mn2064 TaxID=3395263 RepID=UPI003BC83770